MPQHNSKKRATRNANKNGTPKPPAFTRNRGNGSDVDHHRRRLLVVTLSTLIAAIAVLYHRYYDWPPSMKITHHSKKTTTTRHQTQNTPQPKTQKRTTLTDLFRIACSETKLVFCNDYLFEIRNRTLYSRERLEVGWKLLDIPRGVQIWTIDALRDPFIRRELLYKNPRHAKTQQPLYPRAYLTAYLVFLSKERASQRRPKHPLEKLQKAYLDYLPTYEEIRRFHPLVHMDIATRALSSGGTSNFPHVNHQHGTFVNYLLLRTYRELVSEYEAFCSVSPAIFAPTVSWEDYLTTRIQIQSRSFQSNVPLSKDDASNIELEQYAPYLKISTSNLSSLRGQALTSGMVPILDSLNHHSSPNVGWKYLDGNGAFGATPSTSSSSHTTSGSYVVFASQSVSPGSELHDTYGVQTVDSWLLAGYGFADPTDDTSRRGVILSSFHTMHYPYIDHESDYGTSQEQQLKYYLSFDDGYKMCNSTNIVTHPSSSTSSSNESIEQFKDLKLSVLKRLANLQTSWTATVGAPSIQQQQQEQPIEEGGIKDILSTCRLLALTHRDFNGRATHLLQSMLETIIEESSTSSTTPTISSPPLIKRDTDGLEYRTYHWLRRLAQEGRKRMLLLGTKEQDDNHHHESSLDDLETELRNDVTYYVRNNGDGRSSELDTNNNDHHHPSNPEWVASYVRLGEIETLATLSRYAEQKKRTILEQRQMVVPLGNDDDDDDDDDNNIDEDFLVRSKPCHVV